MISLLGFSRSIEVSASQVQNITHTPCNLRCGSPHDKMHPLAVALRRWLMLRMLKRHPIPHFVWRNVTHRMPLLSMLDAVQMARLREMTIWFLQRKSITGAQGFEITQEMKIVVAAQACRLILNLDVSYLEGWIGIILYPGAFRVNHERTDGIGLVHEEASVLTGESWLRGPVVLSWDDVERDAFHSRIGRNVVLHEFAHKLDGLNGTTNGLPPLHRGMNREKWAESLGEAYAELCRQMEAGETACIDPYAAVSPAEFFAVSSEYFFTAPDILKNCFPDVHEQLALFYLQPASH